MKIIQAFCFSFIFIAISFGQATFHYTFQRYLSSHDLLRVFKQKLPLALWDKKPECARINQRAFFHGNANPATGENVYQYPSQAYVKWYTKCLVYGIDSEFSEVSLKKLSYEKYIGKDLLPKISDLGANWSTLEALQRKAIAQHLIREWIGPSIVKNEEAFAIKLSELKEIQTLSIQDALKKLLFYIMTQHEFLTY
jgi:hypothetical protein